MVFAFANSSVHEDLVNLVVGPDIGEHCADHDRDGCFFGKPIEQSLDQDFLLERSVSRFYASTEIRQLATQMQLKMLA